MSQSNLPPSSEEPVEALRIQSPVEPEVHYYESATEALRAVPIGKYGWLRFGIGYLLLGFLWIAGLMVVNAVVLPARLKEVGVDNAAGIVAAYSAFGSITALFGNLIWGSLSDSTRTRFGRRSPWMITGALLAAAFLWGSSVAGTSALLIVVWCLFQLSLNMLLAPALATMSDRVPKSRLGTVATMYGVGVTAGIQIGIIIGAQFIDNTAVGFIVGAVMVGVSAVLALLIWPKEPSTKDLPAPTRSLKDVLLNMRPPGKAPDFWWMFTARFSMLIAYAMVQGFQLYILQEYVGLGEAEVKSTIALGATISLVVSFIGGALGGPVSDLIKRLKLPVFISTLLFGLGIAMLWIWPSTTGYFLWAAIAGFGYGVYNAIDQAILVAVLPDAEKAGKDLGVLNASTTAGSAAGPVITGTIVGAAASYAFVFPVAVGFAVLAAVSVLFIKNVR